MRTRLVVAALLLALLPQTARADHVGVGAWTKQPVIAVDCAGYSGNICGWVDQAMVDWMGAGFHFGATRTGPLPCTYAEGRISVCVDLPGSAAVDCPPLASQAGEGLPPDVIADPPQAAVLGCTYTFRFVTTGAIAGAVIRMCSNCSSSAAVYRVAMAHELGHAIGLGHTTTAGSLMRASLDGTESIQLHDRHAVRDKYLTMPQERLVNVNSGLSLDLSGSQLQNGAWAIQYTSSNADNQRLRLLPVRRSVYAIWFSHSVKVLDVPSTADGQVAVQWDFTNAPTQQVIAAPLGNFTYVLSLTSSGKCLDVQGGSTSPGAPVIQLNCHGGPSQQWRRQPMP